MTDPLVQKKDASTATNTPTPASGGDELKDPLIGGPVPPSLAIAASLADPLVSANNGGGNPEAKKPAPIDPWKLDPNARAKMKELEAAVKAKDKKKVESLVKELTTTHKVPGDVVQAVVNRGDSLWTDGKKLIDGTYDVAGVNDDGNLGTRATINVKKQSATFEGEKNKFVAGAKDKGGEARWTNKENDWTIGAVGGGENAVKVGETEVKAAGGTADASWGDKATGRQTLKTSVAAGKDKAAVRADWNTEAGNTTTERNLGWANTGNDHTIAGGHKTTTTNEVVTMVEEKDPKTGEKKLVEKKEKVATVADTKGGLTFTPATHDKGADPDDAKDDKHTPFKIGASGSHTVTSGKNSTSTTGSVGYTGGVTSVDDEGKEVESEGTLTAEGRHTSKVGDDEKSFGGKFSTGEKGTSLSGDRKVVNGKDSDETKASYEHDEEKGTHTAGFTHTSKRGNLAAITGGPATGTSFGGNVTTEKDGTTAITTERSQTVGDRTESIKETNSAGPDGAARTVTGTVKDGKATTTVSGTQKAGATDGGAFSLSHDDGRRSGKVSVSDETKTADNGSTTSTTAGSVEYGDKGTKSGTEDDVKVKLTGKITEKTSPVSGDQSTKIEGSGNLAFGSTTIDLGVTDESGTKDKTAYEVRDLSAKIGTDITLDEEKKKKLNLSLAGTSHISTKPGDTETFEATLAGKITEGEGKDQSSATFSVTGGQDEANKVANKVLGDKIKPNDALGTGALGTPADGETVAGNYLQLKYGQENQKSKFNLGLDYGQAGNTQFGAARFNYEKKATDDLGKSTVDLFAGVAERDGKFASALSLTTDLALSKKWNVMGGGSYTLTPGTDGYDQVWSAWAGTKYSFAKGKSVMLRGGVAGDGQKLVFMPEVAVKIDKWELSATGAFANGQAPTYQGELKTPLAGLSVFGGYGSMNGMTSPWGSKGTAPDTDWSKKGMEGIGGPGGGYIGIKLDVLKFFNK